MAIDSWERLREVEALMQPGDDHDPLAADERSGDPLDLALPADMLPPELIEPAPRYAPRDGGCRGCWRSTIRARGLCGSCFVRWSAWRRRQAA